MEAAARVAEQESVARLLDGARAALGAGDMPSAHRLLIEAKSRDSGGHEVDLAELEASVLLADGSLLPAAELLERAARQAGPGRAAQLLAAAAMPSIAAGRVDQGLRLAEAAKRVVPAGDEATCLRVDSSLAEAYAADGRWAASVEVWRRAADAAERAGLASDAKTRLLLVEALHSGGLNDQARDLALVATREARQAGETTALTAALQLLFSIEFVTGRIRPARAAAAEELEVAAAEGRLMDHKEALGHLAWCAAHQADAERCRELVARRYELGERLGDDALLHPALGVLELGLGDAPAAAQALRRTLRTLALRGHGAALAMLIVDAELVEALARAGRAPDARAHLEVFEHQAREIGRPHALSLARRCRGLLSDDAQLDAEFEAALAHDEDEPRPLERARSVLCWGMRLRRARRRNEARDKLEEAYEELERLGSELWSARARSELAASGRRPRRRTSTGGELTDREGEVARLVAEGLSNREIAERLYLSTNTVETHLRHIFQKSGVRSRTELVRGLDR
jgi:DNA-binding CsgD family transcriptional regulator